MEAGERERTFDEGHGGCRRTESEVDNGLEPDHGAGQPGECHLAELGGCRECGRRGADGVGGENDGDGKTVTVTWGGEGGGGSSEVVQLEAGGRYAQAVRTQIGPAVSRHRWG